MKNFINSRFALVGLLSFFVTFTVAEDVTNGSLAGQVTNQNGTSIAGASVAVKSEATGITRSSASNGSGSIRIPLLPAGSYAVTVSASGYTTVTDTVKVSLGAASSYNFVLSSASSDIEDVVVRGSVAPSYDFSRTTTGLTIDVDELLGVTPVARDLTSLVLLAPGSTEGDSAFGNLASINGSSVAENVYIINGLNITNFRNFTGSSTVPFEFYEYVDVKTGGYQAEFGKAIGGVVNAVTRSGSNDFTASVSAYMTPDSFRSQSPNSYAADNARRESEQTEVNISVAGPIIKDKLFYYLLLNPDNSEVTTYSLVSERSTNTVLDDEFFGGKLDYYLNDTTHIEYTFFNDDTTIISDTSEYDVLTGKLGTNIGKSYDNVGGENEIFKITSVITDDLTVSYMQGTNEYNRTTSGAGDAFPALYDARSGSFVNVGQNTSFSIDVGDDKREMSRFDIDYYVEFMGSHHFRGGFEEETLTAVNSTINSGGVYYAWFDGHTARGIEFAAKGTDVVRVRNYNSGGTFLTEQEAFYIQDSWDVSDRLNLNIGLRRSTYDNKNAEGITFVKVEDQDAMRLGASYDVFGDGSSKLFYSFGEYYLPIAANTNIRMAGGETYIHTWYKQEDGAPANFLPVGVPVEQDKNNANYLDEYIFGDGTVADTRSTTDNSLEPMYGEETILGYETTLNAGMFKGWNLGTTYVSRELASTIEDVAIDAAVIKYAAANGGLDSSAFTGFHQYVLTNPGTDMNVYIPEWDQTVTLSAADLGYPTVSRDYTAVSVALEKEFDGDWGATLSYTNSESKGNYEGTVKSDNGQDDAGLTQDFDQPGLTDGSYGLLPNNREHIFKGRFNKALRNNVMLGINSTVTSPRSYGCIGYHPTDEFAAGYGASSWYCDGKLTPRGSVAQSSWILNLDMLVSWNVSDNLNVRMDVFNLFDFDSVDDIREFGDSTSTTADKNYLKPTSFQTPRSLRIGFKYTY
ncbi:TonB-dependent receptor [Gammaproteobacteria bacterium]|nr:TonB-dependent receptor [Gammaproteobacteria bacterium]